MDFFLTERGGTPPPPSRTAGSKKPNGKKLTERGGTPPPPSRTNSVTGVFETFPYWCWFDWTRPIVAKDSWTIVFANVIKRLKHFTDDFLPLFYQIFLAKSISEKFSFKCLSISLQHISTWFWKARYSEKFLLRCLSWTHPWRSCFLINSFQYQLVFNMS